MSSSPGPLLADDSGEEFSASKSFDLTSGATLNDTTDNIGNPGGGDCEPGGLSGLQKGMLFMVTTVGTVMSMSSKDKCDEGGGESASSSQCCPAGGSTGGASAGGGAGISLYVFITWLILFLAIFLVLSLLNTLASCYCCGGAGITSSSLEVIPTPATALLALLLTALVIYAVTPAAPACQPPPSGSSLRAFLPSALGGGGAASDACDEPGGIQNELALVGAALIVPLLILGCLCCARGCGSSSPGQRSARNGCCNCGPSKVTDLDCLGSPFASHLTDCPMGCLLEYS